MKLKPPKFLRRLMPELIWELESEDAIYLTFDDGPSVGITDWILSTLKRYDAKATFFVLGRNVELYPQIYERILDGGHAIGNHTYSHLKGWQSNIEDYLRDVQLAADQAKSTLFRPPYAQIRPSQAQALSKRYKLIMWDILSRDYSSNQSPEGCLQAVIKYMSPGSIIVFHDSKKAWGNMSYALPRVLEHAKKMGLRCEVIPR